MSDREYSLTTVLVMVMVCIAVLFGISTSFDMGEKLRLKRNYQVTCYNGKEIVFNTVVKRASVYRNITNYITSDGYRVETTLPCILKEVEGDTQ